MEISWVFTNFRAQEPTLSTRVLKMTSCMTHTWKVNAVTGRQEILSGNFNFKDCGIYYLSNFFKCLRKEIDSCLPSIQDMVCRSKNVHYDLKKTFIIWKQPPQRRKNEAENHAQDITEKVSELQRRLNT